MVIGALGADGGVTEALVEDAESGWVAVLPEVVGELLPPPPQAVRAASNRSERGFWYWLHNVMVSRRSSWSRWRWVSAAAKGV